jgi:signal transduction histidine kinase
VIWSLADLPTAPALKQMLAGEGVQQVISIPLMAKGRFIGALNLSTNRMRSFAPEQIALLKTIGQQVGVAVENARLYEQAERSAQAAERNRLARELHDSVTQSLYSVTLYAEAAARLLNTGKGSEAAQHLRELRDTAQEALREMRLLIFELRPPTLEKSGLVAALQARLEAVEGRGGMLTELSVEGAREAEQVPLAMQEQLFQIAREALNNVLKHAHAQHVRVNVQFKDSVICLQVSDDGVGFDLAQVHERGGLGLTGMQERAQKIGADVRITSEPGQGTCVRVTVEKETA